MYVHYGDLQRVAVLKAIGEQLGVEINGRAVPLLTRLQNHISALANGSHPVYPVICVDGAQLLERQSKSKGPAFWSDPSFFTQLLDHDSLITRHSGKKSR